MMLIKVSLVKSFLFCTFLNFVPNVRFLTNSNIFFWRILGKNSFSYWWNWLGIKMPNYQTEIVSQWWFNLHKYWYLQHGNGIVCFGHCVQSWGPKNPIRNKKQGHQKGLNDDHRQLYHSWHIRWLPTFESLYHYQTKLRVLWRTAIIHLKIFLYIRKRKKCILANVCSIPFDIEAYARSI